MNLLAGKKALIFGIANKHSIAWSIAENFRQHGAEVGLSYAIPQLEKRVMPLAEQIGATFVEKCDVRSMGFSAKRPPTSERSTSSFMQWRLRRPKNWKDVSITRHAMVFV